MRIKLKSFFYILLMLVVMGSYAQARTVTDMAGRVVEIPDKIERVYSPTATGANLIYTLDPDLLVGLVFPTRGIEAKMLDPRWSKLPVLGSLTGEAGALPAPEAMMAAKPDLMVLWLRDNSEVPLDAQIDRGIKSAERFEIPYIFVYAPDLRYYPAAYRFLGDILDREERAETLAAYIEATIVDAEKVVAQVPPAKRPKVYYAEQIDGLYTENAESFHTAVLKLVGDVNVHRKKGTIFSQDLGYEKISLETLMVYNPDVILVYAPTFYNGVKTNPAWKQISAVQNNRILWIPRAPWNWFDRPPSFMGALGVKWLLAELYPEHYPLDIVDEAVKFYHLFLWSQVTHDEMRGIIEPYNFGDYEYADKESPNREKKSK